MPIEPDDLDIPPLPPPPVVHAPPPLRSQLEIVRTGSNARWGAVVAGVFVSCAAWMVLHAFGVGIGATTMTGSGVWSMLAPILALFAGGLVASRLAPTPNRFNRMLQGVLVWAVTTLVAGAAVASIASTLIARTPAPRTEPATDTTVDGLGLDPEQLVAPVNARLRAEDRPPLSAGQLERILDAAIDAAIHDGRLQRETLVSALDDHPALTAGDADEIAIAVEARWYRAAQRASDLATRARRTSMAAADRTGRALLGVSLALMLGLSAAVGGALITGHRDRRRVI
jgi:hypothetical protein